jgi:pseudomonalisin
VIFQRTTVHATIVLMNTRTTQTLLTLLLSPCLGWTQTPQSRVEIRNPLSIRPTNHIIAPIDESHRVRIAGQTHPWARPEYSLGRVAADKRLDRMVLVLQLDHAQQAALEELLRAQQDPDSPHYHQWLAPEDFGKRFGISAHDLDQITKWLLNHGMAVEETPASHRAIIFSANVAQVESAFHTTIRKYSVNGSTHYANANDPEIPAALAPVIHGVVSMHDFRSAPMHVAAPAYTLSNGAHMLMPQDWATIYDVAPLYAQGLDGTGESIAVLGRVDVALSDVRAFRANAALPPHDPQIIINGPDPGSVWCDDEAESALDVEWAGAIARNATVKFVTSKSSTTDGIALSAQYAVNHNIAPIISLSYGLCEAALGPSGNAFWNGLWAQAAAQGISVFVASGDNGVAGCDLPSQQTATRGKAVNGLCSSPFSTCVGGTQFNDAYNSGQYWSQTNGVGESSALGYIPESAWNESSWSGGLWSSGGGASLVYSKPAWQSAPGVPTANARYVPDLALHASILDAYVIQVQGKPFYVSGTSAATPSLASVMALMIEHVGAAQGNANPTLYKLATQQLSAAGSPIFHDITSGDNSVPGVPGFKAGAGYDAVTGLGSVDAALLVNHWKDAAYANFLLIPNVSTISIAQGGSASLILTLIPQGAFTSAVTLTATGAPAGATPRFSASRITAAAPVTITVTIAANATPGTFKITVTGTGGGLTHPAPVTVTIVRRQR